MFDNKPIFGMIHLTGEKKVSRALEEVRIYEEEGVNGIVVENYSGTISDVVSTLKELRTTLQIGINILPNEHTQAFLLAKRYGASFIQLDHVSGEYEQGRICSKIYLNERKHNPEIKVLGGVWPKYYTPLGNLENGLIEGKNRCDAIVVTGKGTGEETPLLKITDFKRVVKDFPLIIGAGMNLSNVTNLNYANGAIVGSYFKIDGKDINPVDRLRVRDFMQAVKALRS